jgi:hypothetical protein
MKELNQTVRQIIASRDPRHSPNMRAYLKNYVRKRGLFGKIVHATDKDGSPFIGRMDDGEMIGAQLGQVLTCGGRAFVACFIGGRPWTVTEGFWDEYVRIGVCAHDVDHWWYPERWATHPEGKSRRCIYCGRKERLKTGRKVTINHVWRVAA